MIVCYMSFREGQGLPMTRREFILSLTAALLCSFGRFAGASATIAANNRLAEDELLKLRIGKMFTDTEAARQVGLEYMALFPEMAGGALGRIGGFVVSSTRGKSTSFRRWLKRQRREDFTNGKSIIINSWVLARCEADLCAALVCLTRR